MPTFFLLLYLVTPPLNPALGGLFRFEGEMKGKRKGQEYVDQIDTFEDQQARRCACDVCRPFFRTANKLSRSLQSN